MTLRYAYNTNGLAHHRLADAVALIADAGYDGVALTPDIHHLDPFAPDHAAARREFGNKLRRRGLGCVVETGARFLLDPRRKHEPTLLCRDEEGRARRVDFLCRALEIAAEAEAETMSFWAGIKPAALDRATALDHLRRGIEAVLRRAEAVGVDASFEPEPGMLIETVAEWDEELRFPELRLALDVGHCLVTQDVDPADAIRTQAPRLGTVHLEDMRRGVHEHLPLGEGDMDIAGVLAALRDVGYGRLVSLELSRDSHRADRLVPETRKVLASLESR